MELSNNNRTFDDKISPPSSPSPSPTKGKYANRLPFPMQSPNRKKLNKVVYGDRYIPNRKGVDLTAAFSLSNQDFAHSSEKKDPETDLDYKREQEANINFSTVLKAELFGDHVPGATPPSTISTIAKQINLLANEDSNNTTNTTDPNATNNDNDFDNDLDDSETSNYSILGRSSYINSSVSTNNILSASNFEGPNYNGVAGLRRGGTRQRNSILRENSEKVIVTSPKSSSNLLSYKSPQKTKLNTSNLNFDSNNELYSLSPVRTDSQRLLLSPQKKPRQISKVPYRVLDAPDLADDFYLNLVDWGSQNILAVALGSCVYLWDAITGSVDRLCDLGDNNKITSLSWIGAGTHLAVGTNMGLVEIWDASTCNCTRTMTGHSSRVGALAWNEHILSSGSRDHSILNRDVRIPEHYINRLDAFHKQEICGLKWNVEENKLASGGNDNVLMVWDGYNTSKPLYKFQDHSAAIKAISWSPHQRGLLASGGGTADRRIKIWNTLTGTKLNDIDTGSQVCNLLWSKNSNELVSTHGYSKNQIVIWKYNHLSSNGYYSDEQESSFCASASSSSNSYQLQQVASLTGHTYRVLYLAMSPDGETIVTGAGDETLRFWKVFDKSHDDGNNSILLNAFMQLR